MRVAAVCAGMREFFPPPHGTDGMVVAGAGRRPNERPPMTDVLLDGLHGYHRQALLMERDSA